MGAKVKVTQISAQETENVVSENKNLSDNVTSKDKTNIHPDLLDIAQETVANIIEDAKTKVVDIKKKEVKSQNKIAFVVIKARNLEKSGFIGKSDPYVVIRCCNEEFKSQTVNNSQNPQWDFSTHISFDKDIDELIEIEVYDEDIGKDDKIGEVKISKTEVLREGGISNKWYKLEKCKSGEILISANFSSTAIKTHFQEVEVVKTRDCEEDDRYSRSSTVEQLNIDETVKVKEQDASNIKEVEVEKVRKSDEEDRFSRPSIIQSRIESETRTEMNEGVAGVRNLLNNKTNTKSDKMQYKESEKESVNPELLIVAKETVSSIIDSAKEKVTNMKQKERKPDHEDKNKKEQVQEMITDFLKSDDEDDEEEPYQPTMVICKKEEETPDILKVSKETVSNVIDKAKLEVERISNLEQGDNIVGNITRKEEITEASMEEYEGAKGL